MLTLSQVIYGVRDLDAATRRIEARGLTVIEGGRHPGLGTANRIVPLGDAYFELLGVVDETEARSNPYGQALLRQIAQGDQLVRWSLRTDDLAPIAAARGLAVEQRSRRRPDGTLLTWRAAGLSLALVAGWLPFFMQWDDPTQYPGLLPTRHRAAPRGVAWLELTPGDPDLLRHWIGDAADTVHTATALRFVPGNPGLHCVALQTAHGELVLP